MSATEKLDGLMDTTTLMRELGIKRNAADILMRQLPKIIIPGQQKNYVRRQDVKQLLEENTFDVVTAEARKRRAA